VVKDDCMTSAADGPGHAPGSPTREIEPDQKDWTWVLGHRCPECGFDAALVPAAGIAARLRENAARWPAVCSRADTRVRPEPGVWSPLEYACHVRDVCRVFEARVSLMRSQVNPALENWNQNDAAIAGAYSTQDPEAVSAELLEAAEAAAGSFDAVADGDWQRTGLRTNGSLFTLKTLGRYFLHDLTHHLHDVHG
jgi:DinB superfamily